MKNQAILKLGEPLVYFLRPDRKTGEVLVGLHQGVTVKHLVESLGIPHPEIGNITVNGEAVNFEYKVRNEDTVVLNEWKNDLNARIEGPPRFFLDCNVGKLAGYLRLLGFDTLYKKSIDDDELALASVGEDRILITRDRRLLMRKIVTRGYCPRSLLPREQLHEVIDRFGGHHWIRPYSRCVYCNSQLLKVEMAEVYDRLQPLTRKYYDKFSTCPSCGKVFWQGSHFERLQDWIKEYL